MTSLRSGRHIKSRSINEIWQPTPLLSISIITPPPSPVSIRPNDKYWRKWCSRTAQAHALLASVFRFGKVSQNERASDLWHSHARSLAL